MTFIDWSDAEGMVELFEEFIRDEMNDSLSDTERQQFLSNLLGDVERIREVGMEGAIQRLRTIQESLQEDFREDPASLHLADLIDELERIRST
jgi:molecular chaperone DnaK (HSP70)